MTIKQPDDLTVDTANVKVSLEWNPAFDAEWNRKFFEAQKWLDNEVLKLNAKYIPFQTGALNRSGILGTTLGEGHIVYASPYARYLYYGKVMRDAEGRAFYGKAPKHTTDEALHYHGEPQRGKLWFERMKAAHKKQLLKGVAKLMK